MLLITVLALASESIIIYTENQVSDIDVTTYSSGETEYYNAETGISLFIQELPTLNTDTSLEVLPPVTPPPAYDVRDY